MCNAACIRFGEAHLSKDDIRMKKVIEVGALDLNGSLRRVVDKLEPLTYLGVDICNGRGVDEICDVNDLVARYGRESFDVVISTELIEHVRNWRNALSNLKNILRPHGVLLLTTRSKGFDYHGHPFDFWRYEAEDMKLLFSELCIEVIERDCQAPGVFVKARKPAHFSETNLEAHALYSMIKKRRCKDISELHIFFFKAKRLVRRLLAGTVAGRRRQASQGRA